LLTSGKSLPTTHNWNFPFCTIRWLPVLDDIKLQHRREAAVDKQTEKMVQRLIWRRMSHAFHHYAIIIYRHFHALPTCLDRFPSYIDITSR